MSGQTSSVTGTWEIAALRASCNRIVQKRLATANLNENRWQTAEVRIDWRRLRIGWGVPRKVSFRDLKEQRAMDQRIAGVKFTHTLAGYCQIGNRTQRNERCGLRPACIAYADSAFQDKIATYGFASQRNCPVVITMGQQPW